jgi:hypothetical protein
LDTLDRKGAHAVCVERFASDHNSGNTDEIEHAFGKRHAVACRQDNVNEAALVGNKKEGAAGGGAEFCAEGVIVGVGVCAQKTIGVGEFSSESCGFPKFGFTGEKFEVPVVGHFLRFGKIGDKTLDLSESHVVQAVVVSELKTCQKQHPEDTECCDQEFFSWARFWRS